MKNTTSAMIEQSYLYAAVIKKLPLLSGAVFFALLASSASTPVCLGQDFILHQSPASESASAEVPTTRNKRSPAKTKRMTVKIPAADAAISKAADETANESTSQAPIQAPSQILWQQTARPKKHLLKQVIVLSSDQLFDPSNDTLTPAGEAKLNALAATFRVQAGHQIGIVGHSDGLGFAGANQDLSRRCAQRIKSWIVSHGLARSIAVDVRGAGSNEPICSEKLPSGLDNSAGRARNRRLVITIDPNVDVAQRIASEQEAKTAEREALAQRAAAQAEKAKAAEELVEPMLVPVTEADLNQQSDPRTNNGTTEHADHPVNTAEWGSGGSNFGEHTDNSLGSNISGFGGGDGAQYNKEGKRVQRITPIPVELERRRQETIEAQDEFGLYRER